MKEYESASTVSSFIRQYVHYRPQIAILCGTGFDAIADLISSPRILRFDDIPGFPNCEVPSSASRIPGKSSLYRATNLGTALSRYGADFEPAFDTYDRRLRDITRSSVNELNTPVCLHEGVYFHMATSSLCTPATTRMLQTVGCDAVGEYTI
ncbi:unnamed protein product [Schistocephalus solidus]|uniref:Uncharacterized protein n=1 Tax=Schistocephalus solidus TaxID=70667 RepID=A0A183SC91_SCHSO|nr:unnamed protein product [Schistocephalus solidus]VDL88224.1 unnamed protein product [Schistocephalus solidus]